MAKMTTAIRLDFDKNLIILNSTFAKKARRIGSPEYNQLQRFTASSPPSRLSSVKSRRNPTRSITRGLLMTI